jgi:hypothetical protein
MTDDVLRIGSDELAVGLLPGKGCDVLEVIDRASGIDVLFKAPWGRGRVPAFAPDSYTAWLNAYPGGWQVMLPNAGAACVEHGVEWGFHGEAALATWTVDAVEAASARLSVRLLTAPLAIDRECSVAGRVFRLEEAVTNLSDRPLEVMWGHHPTFGAPFLDGSCTIETSARTFVVDDETNTLLEPGASCEWPFAPAQGGGDVDLSRVPGAGDRRAVLGYLGDFADGSYSIASPSTHLRASLRWDLALFPHAWLWQEVHATSGFPWYGRAYTLAIEPNTTVPAKGVTVARARGGTPLTLGAGETRATALELELATL